MNGQQLLDALLDIQRRGLQLDRLKVVVHGEVSGQSFKATIYPKEVAEYVNSGMIILK